VVVIAGAAVVASAVAVRAVVVSVSASVAADAGEVDEVDSAVVLADFGAALVGVVVQCCDLAAPERLTDVGGERVHFGLGQALREAGQPHGLILAGYRAIESLRLEKAYRAWGSDIGPDHTPLMAGLGWAVKLDKGDFVGRDALLKFRDDPGSTRIGLELEGKRIARQGTPVLLDDAEVGRVTSGTFSPTLGKSLAMALVQPAVSAPGTALVLDVRGKTEPAKVVPLPFYKRP